MDRFLRGISSRFRGTRADESDGREASVVTPVEEIPRAEVLTAPAPEPEAPAGDPDPDGSGTEAEELPQAEVLETPTPEPEESPTSDPDADDSDVDEDLPAQETDDTFTFTDGSGDDEVESDAADSTVITIDGVQGSDDELTFTVSDEVGHIRIDGFVEEDSDAPEAAPPAYPEPQPEEEPDDSDPEAPPPAYPEPWPEEEPEYVEPDGDEPADGQTPPVSGSTESISAAEAIRRGLISPEDLRAQTTLEGRVNLSDLLASSDDDDDEVMRAPRDELIVIPRVRNEPEPGTGPPNPQPKEVAGLQVASVEGRPIRDGGENLVAGLPPASGEAIYSTLNASDDEPAEDDGDTGATGGSAGSGNGGDDSDSAASGHWSYVGGEVIWIAGPDGSGPAGDPPQWPPAYILYTVDEDGNIDWGTAGPPDGYWIHLDGEYIWIDGLPEAREDGSLDWGPEWVWPTEESTAPDASDESDDAPSSEPREYFGMPHPADEHGSPSAIIGGMYVYDNGTARVVPMDDGGEWIVWYDEDGNVVQAIVVDADGNYVRIPMDPNYGVEEAPQSGSLNEVEAGEDPWAEREPAEIISVPDALRAGMISVDDLRVSGRVDINQFVNTELIQQRMADYTSEPGVRAEDEIERPTIELERAPGEGPLPQADGGATYSALSTPPETEDDGDTGPAPGNYILIGWSYDDDGNAIATAGDHGYWLYPAEGGDPVWHGEGEPPYDPPEFSESWIQMLDSGPAGPSPDPVLEPGGDPGYYEAELHEDGSATVHVEGGYWFYPAGGGQPEWNGEGDPPGPAPTPYWYPGWSDNPPPDDEQDSPPAYEPLPMYTIGDPVSSVGQPEPPHPAELRVAGAVDVNQFANQDLIQQRLADAIADDGVPAPDEIERPVIRPERAPGDDPFQQPVLDGSSQTLIGAETLIERPDIRPEQAPGQEPLPQHIQDGTSQTMIVAESPIERQPPAASLDVMESAGPDASASAGGVTSDADAPSSQGAFQYPVVDIGRTPAAGVSSPDVPEEEDPLQARRTDLDLERTPSVAVNETTGPAVQKADVMAGDSVSGDPSRVNPDVMAGDSEAGEPSRVNPDLMAGDSEAGEPSKTIETPQVGELRQDATLEFVKEPEIARIDPPIDFQSTPVIEQPPAVAQVETAIPAAIDPQQSQPADQPGVPVEVQPLVSNENVADWELQAHAGDPADDDDDPADGM